MATNATTDAVQKLYLGYYGRPADSAGLAYWANQLDTNGSSYEAVIAAFTQAPESLALYGPAVTVEARIALIYHQFFNRDVEAAGMAYWKPLVENGTFTLGRLALSILTGAQNADKTAVENKLTVADLFTSLAAGTQSKYDGTSAAAVGRTLLDLITSESASITTGTNLLPAYLNTVNVASLNPDLFTPYIKGGVLTNTDIVSTQLTALNVSTLAASFVLTEANNVVTLTGIATDALTYTINGAAVRGDRNVSASSGSLTNSVVKFDSSGFSGSTIVTLNAASNSFTGGSGADTLKLLAFAPTGTLNGGTGAANTLVVTDGANLVGATITNFTNLRFDATGVSGTNDLTLTAAQHTAITGTVTGVGTGTNAEKVLITTAFTGTGFAAVENYLLAAASTFALGAAAQNVSASGAADTISVESFAATGVLEGGSGTVNVLKVKDGASISGATLSNFVDLTFDATGVSGTNDLTLTAAQYAVFIGTIAAAGTGANGEKMIFTTALTGARTLQAAVENFTLSAGANSVTTGSAGQTINAGALASGELLTLAGTHNATVTLVAGNLTSTSSGNITVTATTGNNTIITGAGADTVTGGPGSDTITLGGGADVVVFNSLTGADTLTDYVVGTDRINLSKAVYTALAGAVNDVTLGADFASVANAAALTGGSVAASTNAQAFVYLQDARTLYYNSDAGTAGGLTLVGTFNTGVLLVATEFTIIA